MEQSITELNPNSADTQWSKISTYLKSFAEETTASLKTVCLLLQKLNKIYNDISSNDISSNDISCNDISNNDHHANSLISACCHVLTEEQRWSTLDSKLKINVAKILSHLSVKLLGVHDVCMSSCELLLALLLDSCLDHLPHDRLSIAGYVYKSLWNRHSTASSSQTSQDIEFIGRVMAVRLAIAGSLEHHILKLPQQISVTVAGCSTLTSYQGLLMRGLAQIKDTVEVTVARADQVLMWKHLSLFISCLETLYSDNSSDLQVPDGIEDTGALCRQLIGCYKCVRRNSPIPQPASQDVWQFLDTCSGTMQLQGMALVLNRCTKLISKKLTGEKQTQTTWKDLLLADIYMCRKLHDLEVEQTKKDQCVTQELYTLGVLLRISADLLNITYPGESLVNILTPDIDMLASINITKCGHEAKRVTDLVADVGRNIQLCAAKGKLDDADINAIKLLGTSVLNLVTADHLDTGMAIQKPLYSLLLEYSAYTDASDILVAFGGKLSKELWYTQVSDWCKIKKRARQAGNASLSSRTLAVHCYGNVTNKDEKMDLLYKEYCEYSLREVYYEDLSVLLREMSATSVSASHRALRYLCEVELHVTLCKDLEFAEECISKGLAELKNNTSAYCNDMKAQLHMWRYLIHYNECCTMPSVTAALTHTEYQAPATTFKFESKMQQSLYAAVSLWHDAAQDNTSSLCCEQKTAECLDIIASTFYSSKRFNKLIEVCVLTRKLLSTKCTPVSILIMHAEALIWFGDHKQAGEVIAEATERNCVTSIDGLQICKARLYLHTQNVDTAVKVLEDVIERQSKQSLNSVYISATARCLLLDMLMNCTSVVTKHTITHHSWYCQRDYASLFNSMTSTPVQTHGTKLRYLDAILSSYIMLGKVNLFIGDVRECTCFLAAALNMAQLLSLPLRAADVATHQAQLSYFVDDFIGSEANLRRAHTILTSEVTLAGQRQQLRLKTPDVTQTPQRAGRVRKDLAKVKRVDMFGFESDGDDNSFSIQQPAGAISDEEDGEYKVPSYGTSVSGDITASPSFKTKKSAISYFDWAPYKHSSSCVCEYCEELVLHVTHLQMLNTISVLKFKSGLSQEGLTFCEDYLFCFKAVENRSAVIATPESPKLVSCKLQYSTIIMKWLFAMSNYTDMEIEWRKVKLMPVTSYHSLALSQLFYLKYLPQIIYYHQTRTEISDLNLKMKYLEVSDKRVYSPLQQIKTGNINVLPPSSAIGAPKKNRRVAASRISKLAFDDSDSEDLFTELLPRKSGKKTNRSRLQSCKLGSLTESPLVTSSVKLKSKTKKSSITVFCDDDQENARRGCEMSGEKLLEPKRSSRIRNKSSVGGDSLEMSQPVRPRKTRSANREAMRIGCTEDTVQLPSLNEDMFALGTDVSEQDSLKSSQAVHTKDVEYEDMEIFRGDPAEKATEDTLEGSTANMSDDVTSVIKLKHGKCSSAESMRSAAPSRCISPPELVVSPTSELLSPLSANYNELNCDELIVKLTAVWESIRFTPPFLFYRNICQSLGILHYNKSDSWKAAFYLMESQAITFSHKADRIYTQKLHQRNKESKLGNIPPVFELPSTRTLQSFKSAVKALPEGWVTSSIAVVPVPSSQLQHLYLTRLEKNQDPVVLLASDVTDAKEIWREFEDILKASKDSMNETEKSAWWDKRRKADEQLKDLLSRIQLQLGVSRTALIGCYVDKKSKSVVNKYTERVVKEMESLNVSVDRNLIKMLVNGANSLELSELLAFFEQRYPELSEEGVKLLSALIKKGGQVNMDTREPVIVCLDKMAHSFCWESMEFLSENAVTRMPSIYSIQTYLQVLSLQPNSIFGNGIDAKNTFYILNPDDNLPSTESAFKPILASKKSWKGIVCKMPTAEEYKNGLTDHELFIFIGHGSGSKYLKGREVCQLHCNAAVLLMGCSSGALDSRGEMESAGIIYDYHIALCPTILACLWDVTDKDIDRYTKCMLKNWLASDKDGLSDHIPSARRACKLQYLVGSASVVYGLPVSMCNK